MKKKVFTLDIDEAEVSFSGIAVTFWQTAMVGFEFALALNRLYDIDLERGADLVLPGFDAPWPHYSSPVDERLLRYDLIDRPFGVAGLGPVADTSDKILIISGRDAWERTDRIVDDATGRHPAGSPLAQLAAEVVTVQAFDFDPRSEHSIKPADAAYRHYDALKALCETILAALDLAAPEY